MIGIISSQFHEGLALSGAVASFRRPRHCQPRPDPAS